MPVYEYKCRTCRHKFERRKSFDQASEPDICPMCLGVALRIISRPALIQVEGGTINSSGSRSLGKQEKEIQSEMNEKSSDVVYGNTGHREHAERSV